jgi:hypothetical protein
MKAGDLEIMRKDICLFKFVVLDIMLIVHTETCGAVK